MTSSKNIEFVGGRNVGDSGENGTVAEDDEYHLYKIL